MVCKAMLREALQGECCLASLPLPTFYLGEQWPVAHTSVVFEHAKSYWSEASLCMVAV